MEKVKFVMLCGLPASGKSTYCEQYKHNKDWIVLSSDEIRAELLDNVNDQSQNELVFKTLHSRVKEDLLNGKNVAYDATNLSRKRRINFISNELRDIPCEKICVLFATPIEICKANNANRERKVPEDVIDRMYLNYDAPWYSEGFNEIQIVWWDYAKEGMKFDFHNDIEIWRSISHNNIHHSHSIGEHMLEAWKYMRCKTSDFLLEISALMHDCGKIHTKKFIDSKGNPTDGVAHYYQHHCCGSFLSLFYLKELFKEDYTRLKDDEILYVSLLINLHMRHHMAYKQSDKAKEKDRRLFGDDIMKSLELLYEVDLLSH